MPEIATDVLKITATLAVIAAALCLYLRLLTALDLWTSERFGFSLKGHKSSRLEPPKVEVQTLFDGNTTDQDQI